MSILLSLALLQAVAGSPTATASANATAFCANPGWQGAFTTQGLTCVAARHGIVIAPPERAGKLAPLIDSAAARYETHFGRPAQPIAVVDSSSVSGPQGQLLRQHGFLNLSWPAPADPKEDVRVLPHELAHLWFGAWYDSKRTERAPQQYASSAPDWLDEAAAILNENQAGVTERRTGLVDLLRGNAMRLHPLAEFLKMSHPNLTSRPQATLDPNNLPPGATRRPDGSIAVPMDPGSMPRIDPNNLPPGATRMPGGGIFIPAKPGQGGGSFTVREQNADPTHQRTMLPFYIQALAVADFLREKTRNPRVMMELATAMRDGRSFEQWLSAEGRRQGLPADLTGLSKAWDAWLQQKSAAQQPAA